MKPDTVIEVWKSNLDKMAAVTKAGLRGIYSTCWYLNYFYYGADDHWKEVCACENSVCCALWMCVLLVHCVNV